MNKIIMMKTIAKYALMVAVGLGAASALSSCDDDKDEYGLKVIYMPQAAILNGGLTNEYPVPMPNMPVPNYEIDDQGRLQIVMGVYRSGEGDLSGYSVDLFVDEDDAASEIKSMANGVVLDSKYITVPERLTVEAGSRQKTFRMIVDLPRILDEHPEYYKNKLVAVVGITNPSKWELNYALSRTTVVIQGAEFLPVVPILKHGNFGNGASQSWHLVNVNNKPFDLMKIDENAGELQIGIDDYTPYADNSRWMCYQKLESSDLQKGVTYIMSCKVNIPAQNFVMTSDTQNLQREMDLGFAIFPNYTDMATQSDYKPGDMNFLYMDLTMDNGKSRYALYNGTDGFQSFSDLRSSARPDAMKKGEFTFDDVYEGGYIVFYVRLRKPCPSVKTIRVTDVQIVAK